ncbi:hypothetical protein BCR33DRAFT_457818 [Rhizoclosmatium globosum]|uniref:Uncharacterized protein n=1 Tax=Rhizoclosmatium globosum TaxID=329046 RepID=A0A1Y2CWX9_9FUNG|nr:hypothetical protein BCR33DRAFT_457818 [Rhizoclosmatium globosum]|eukprot:ORY51529.1 hypothetical protein BCR33DRAFT_457818 [Rhizoclosmatium globosum]
MVLLVLVIISGFIYMLRGHRKHLLRNPPLEWGYHAPYPFTWKDPFRKLFEVPDVEYWRIIKSWIIFCSFPMYPMLVSRSLLYFNCGLVLSDNTYSVLFLKELPYVKCGESEFMSLMKPSIVSFVCWCVIPPLVNAFFLVGFYKSRHTKEFYQAYWPLYKPYHADNIVWLSINLAFICLFHATTVVFKTTDDQMTAGSIVMLLEMAAVAWRRPWHEEFIAYLDLIQHGSILIFLMFARRITNDNIQEYDVLLSAIILVTIFALLFLMSWMLLHSIFPSFYLPKSLHRFNQIPTSELDIAESGSGSQKLRPQSTSQSPSPANFGANTFVAKENNKRVALRDRKDNILGTGSF